MLKHDFAKSGEWRLFRIGRCEVSRGLANLREVLVLLREVLRKRVPYIMWGKCGAACWRIESLGVQWPIVSMRFVCAPSGVWKEGVDYVF